ncbi:pyruvate/2-oxoglutarate dehydrogenase complex dihydrolipoamide acyltransferase (E2) component [Rhodococcus sp. LBL1]|nr:pyruvate/2-oxoglutarate dehydrogenase complex dihydrolipoamide acyltransferase (E2) component [Rhodococcus sp. LBL1]MDH6685643.1 pyruvate/2-oxoglutarate dehydrogenase complex dihydrolipoamide acyltransferase (E2) component [Rhodococcus sp. LBL2]
MTSTRAVIAVATTAGVLLLTACGGTHADTDRTATGTASATAASSTGTSTATSASVTASAPDPASAVPAAADSPAPTAAPTTTVASPAPATTAPPAPRATPGEIDSRSPEQIVAQSGERGQRYLAGLRAAGIPPTGMDAAEVLYAQGTCDALARGDSRTSVLAEFDSVGKTYAQFLPMSASRIAEIYVSTAETTYC